MKKNLISVMIAAIVVILMFSSAAAQVAMNNASKNDSKILQDARIGFTSTGIGFTEKNISAAEVNFHALKDFKKRFEAVSNAAWFATENGYLAKFNSNEMQTSVAYQKNGKWIYSISRYYEKNMSAEVRAEVKSKYYDFTILGIEEISTPRNDQKVFLVHLQDDTSLKVVRVCDGDMTVIGDYKRG